jgi:hypothetical protein
MFPRELAGTAAPLTTLDPPGSARICAIGGPFQFVDTSQRSLPEHGGIARDGYLAHPLDLRNASIKSRDQFEEFTNPLVRRHRHRRRPGRTASRRDVFQTSPQIVQRQ